VLSRLLKYTTIWGEFLASVFLPSLHREPGVRDRVGLVIFLLTLFISSFHTKSPSIHSPNYQPSPIVAMAEKDTEQQPAPADSSPRLSTDSDDYFVRDLGCRIALS
jgi:hypothetical protein